MGIMVPSLLGAYVFEQVYSSRLNGFPVSLESYSLDNVYDLRLYW